jgi:hypothetical protein
MNITIIVGIIMLSVFIVPVWIVMQRQKKNRKKLEAYLASLEREKNIKITEHETWSNKVIGLDSEHGNALFVTEGAGGKQVNLVDLHQVSRCIAERSTISSESKSSLQAVSAVRIRFVARNKAYSDKVFVLYNEDTDGTIGSEIRLADAWVERFNKLIKSMPKAA